MDRTYYARTLSGHRLDRVYEVASPRVRQYLAAEIAHVADALAPGDRVLELGCGCGRALVPLARKTGAGWGVDNAVQSLRLAARRHPELHLAAMDAAALGFSPAGFDMVVGIQNFISACKAPPRQVLQQALHVTRRGGRIVLSSYAESFWPFRLEWFRRQAEEGLLGPIDEEATGGGVIVCTDGFKATTFSPDDFTALARFAGVPARVFTVDDSSVFCEIIVP
jgi:SAM-dependent methyltransferase